MNPLRVAFVGAGNIARFHLLALRRVRTPHLVVGVYDRDADASRRFARLAEAPSYRTLDELLATAQPNVVHVCTPAGMHFEPAREALLAGAHVYVEKPFVETTREADELLATAAKHRLLVCAGHQQLHDPAYRALLERAPELGDVVQVDSYFTFRPVGPNAERASAAALAAQLVDVLPHPLYTLCDALQRLVAPASSDPISIAIASVVATPRNLYAVLRTNTGNCFGRLAVSLCARPVASLLAVSGTGGTLTADFLRSSVVGAANPGVTPLEKAANPLLEAWQLAVRSVAGVTRRMIRGGAYPGQAELFASFYAAIATGAASPVLPHHLRHVTALFEELAANVRSATGAAARARQPALSLAGPPPDAPLVVVTGARGFFGREITKQLSQRGYRVRGISRSADEEDPHVHEWLRLDLSRSAPGDAFAGADAVVHAAAASSGDYDAHQRHTLDATRNVLRGMQEAEVSRLVYISSLSVLRPPRTPWDEQDEHTPLTLRTERQYGPYVWGKSCAEQIVVTEAPTRQIEARIIRPGALVDWTNPDPPGLMGRRLFGRWHLGFGRPGLPLPVCEVGRAAAVVAWTVAEFADAPPVLNLIESDIGTRRSLLRAFARYGWHGRFVWVPLPLFVALAQVARHALAVAALRPPPPLALYAILRPRRYNSALAEQVMGLALRGSDGAEGQPARVSESFDASPAWSS